MLINSCQPKHTEIAIIFIQMTERFYIYIKSYQISKNFNQSQMISL